MERTGRQWVGIFSVAAEPPLSRVARATRLDTRFRCNTSSPRLSLGTAVLYWLARGKKAKGYERDEEQSLQ